MSGVSFVGFPTGVHWKVSERDGSHTGEVVLSWALVEQAQHEHISDQYKKTVHYSYTSFFIMGECTRHRRWFTIEPNKGGKVKRTNRPLKYVSYNETTEAIIASYWRTAY